MGSGSKALNACVAMLVLHRYEKGSNHGSAPPSCLAIEPARAAFLPGGSASSPPVSCTALVSRSFTP